MGGLLSVLFVRLWYFAVVIAPDLQDKAEASRNAPVPKPAPRGLIFDRQGVLVAGVRPEIVITGVPAILKKNPEVLPEIANLLGVDVSKLEKRLKEGAWRPFLSTPIYMGANFQTGSKIAEAGDRYPGIGVETQSVRYYPDSVSLTHTLGYVGIPGDKDKERYDDSDMELSAYVGKNGIERAYDFDLIGIPGQETFEIDAKRRPVKVTDGSIPTPGKQLILTVDMALQKFAVNLLVSKGFRGSIVALDPSNGEILCIANAPNYDSTVISRGISEEDWDILNKGATAPMQNRGLASAYAPGSTFKVVTALAAIRT